MRTRALLVQMLLELKSPRGAPARCLTCLSARSPRVRLAAARALERFAGPALFREYVVQLGNDRGDEPAWKIPAETVDDLAELLAHGSPAARARTAYLLRHLSEKEQAACDQAPQGRIIPTMQSQLAHPPLVGQVPLRHLIPGQHLGLHLQRRQAARETHRDLSGRAAPPGLAVLTEQLRLPPRHNVLQRWS